MAPPRRPVRVRRPPNPRHLPPIQLRPRTSRVPHPLSRSSSAPKTHRCRCSICRRRRRYCRRQARRSPTTTRRANSPSRVSPSKRSKTPMSRNSSKRLSRKIAAGYSFFAADMEPEALLKLADAFTGKDALILNIGSADDSLREENCRANVVHLPPTRTMLADALAQYFAWKQWRNWFLISGPQPEDKLFADAIRRAAKRFGAKIVEEREFKYEAGSRRADGGFEQVQQQIPGFTQRRQGSRRRHGRRRRPAVWRLHSLPDLDHRARSPEPPVSSPQAGTRRSNCGAARSSRTASSA